MASILTRSAGAESAPKRVLEPHTTFTLAPHDSWQPTTLWSAHVCSFLDPERCRQLRRMAEEHVLAHGWELSRHKRFATTDFAVASSPSLADALEPLLRWTIVPTLCDLYGFEESDIRMKDLFFVKYEAPRSTDADGDADADAGTVVQDRLSPHRDGTLLSFNVLLSEPRVEFSGGGTRFASLGEACSACGGAGEGAGAVASDVASCEACDADGSGSASGEGACEACEACPVCFGMGTEKLRPVNMGDLTLHCGKLLHEGAVVTEGIRYIIVGFVDVFNMETVDHEFLKCYRAANTSRRSTEIDYECATRAFLAPA